jgi:hypothetical protein
VPVFKEVQHFQQPWVRILLASVTGVFLWGCYHQLVRGEPWGQRPMSNLALVTMTLGVVGFSCWLLRTELVTEVRDREVCTQFKMLWKPRRIPYAAVLSAEPVTFSPMKQYGGWGIRRGRYGWAYTVRGNRGVQLTLAGGEKFLIGSQRAEELAQAIRSQMDRQASGGG